MVDECRACGSPSAGTFVCHYCGAAIADLSNPEDERSALDELHGHLTMAETSEKILQNAFIPRSPEVLIDAGLRLLPVLEKSVAEHEAAGRLRAIIIKLDLVGSDEAATHAAAEFRKALADYRATDRRMGMWVMGILFAAIGGIGYLIWGSG